MIEHATPHSIRSALEAVAAGEGGSMLEATAKMTLEEAQAFAMRWILEHEMSGVRVRRAGPFLQIEPDVQATK